LDLFIQEVSGLRETGFPTGGDLQDKTLWIFWVDREANFFKFRCSSGVAQNHSEPQTNELMTEILVIKVNVEFPEFPTVAQYQQAESMQLRHAEAWCVTLIQNVRTMLMVVAVGDDAADFMQLSSPLKLLFELDQVVLIQSLGGDLAHEELRDIGHPSRLIQIHRKRFLESFHGEFSGVLGQIITLDQVKQNPMTKSTLSTMELFNFQKVKINSQI
jgi:hypothetical protein